MSEFCRFLKQGLVYNNDTTVFTVSPCCYYSKNYPLTSAEQLNNYKQQWLAVDHDACRLCLDMESAGQASYRQASFDLVSPGDKLQVLTVAVNKQCNLACPSCDAGSSSFWYQENQRNGHEQSAGIHQLHEQNRQGVTDEHFVELLKEIDLSELRYIKFGGGEPLMSSIHAQILESIPCPEQVTVHYTSNFSIMPTASVLELWTRFRLVKWVASIDGIEDQFEFLRWPHTWIRINKLIDRAQEQVPHNTMFGVEHTLNPLNIFYYDRFKSWFDQEFGTNRYGDASDFNLHPCHGVLSIDNTPPELRRIISQRYGRDHPVVRMLDKHPYSGSTQAMVKYLDRLDQERNHDWRTTFSEVESYFD